MLDMIETENKVAILLATYNGGKFIDVQLQSLKDQTFQDFICYIHDDNSKDSTVSIIKKYTQQYPEQFKFIQYEGSHGAVGNFMSLAHYVRNNTNEPYIMFCDQDDYWFPDKIEKQINALKKMSSNAEPHLVYCNQEIVDRNLNLIAASGMDYSKRKAGIDDSFKELVFENCAAGCTMAFNRAALEVAIDNYQEGEIVMHDWWFMLIARCFGEISYVDETLMKYRQHGTNTLGADNKLLSGKIRKYLCSLKKSMHAKSAHVKKCEKQIINIWSIQEHNKYKYEIDRVVTNIKKNKIVRIWFLMRKGYIKPCEAFTLLFV